MRVNESNHWRRFNVAMRVAGVWWTFGGLGFLGWAIYYAFDPSDLPPQQTITGSPAIDFSIIGAAATALGLYGALRGPYRPDLGDAFFRGSHRSGFPWLPVTPRTGPRSWWTIGPRS